MSAQLTASGVVKYVNQPNKYGFTSIRLEADDRYYNFGKSTPAGMLDGKKRDLQQGDHVTFDYVLKDGKYANVDPYDVVISAAPQSSSGSSGGTSSGTSFADNNLREQRYRSAAHLATNVMDVMLKNGVVPWPANAAKKDLQGLVLAQIQLLTDTFNKGFKEAWDGEEWPSFTLVDYESEVPDSDE